MEKKTRILICDDEPGVLEALKMILKETDYELVFANNGAAALEIVQSQKLDLFLLDIIMPKLNGVEVAQQVHKIKPELKIVVITALSHQGVAAQLCKHGVVDIILKPIEKDTILKIIAQTLQK